MFHQSQLHELEIQLKSLDEELGEEKPDALADHRSFVRGIDGKDHKELILKVDKKLEQYGEQSLLRADFMY